jgi:mRNA interferase MazF
MGRFIKGEVVVVPFPFSDLSNFKRRPALVLAPLKGDDVILCQITTISRGDGYSVRLSDSDFRIGTLHHESNVRPNRIFTAEESIIVRSIGEISQTKIDEVMNRIINILTV